MPVDGVASSVAIVAAAFTWAVAKLALSRRKLAHSQQLIVPSTPDAPGSLYRVVLGHLPEILMTQGEAGNGQMHILREVTATPGASAAQIVGLGIRGIAPLDPRDVEYIFLSNGSNYVKGSDYEAVKLFTGKNGLVTIRDEAVHTLHRRLLGPAFSPAALDDMYDTAVRHRIVRGLEQFAARLLSSLPTTAPPPRAPTSSRSDDNDIHDKKTSTDAANGPFEVADLEPFFDRLTLDIIAGAAFRDTDVEGLSIPHEFETMVSSALDALVYVQLPGGWWTPSPAVRRIRTARHNLRVAAKKVLDATAKHNNNDGGVGSAEAAGGTSARRKVLVDYLALTLEMDEASRIDHALTFMLAGHETTSTSMLWLTYLLAVNPRVQDCLYDELQSAMSLTQMPSLTSLRALPYLNNVVKELLRLCPPVTGVSRVSVLDDVLPSGLVVPANSYVMIFVYALHHDPRTWGPDAEEFRPERWEEAETLQRAGQAGWMPFMIGKRNCIGQQFAMNELLAVAALMARRYRLSWPEGQPRPVRQEKLTMRTKSTFRVNFTKR